MLPWVRNRLFREFHRRTLIYTACCEDPAVDRRALRLSPADRVLVITSGGCNALDYLLAGAGEVNAVDLNPCQSALLEFKAAAIRTLDYREFWELLGTGRSRQARAMYGDAIRWQLSSAARRFWDRRISWFGGRDRWSSFYFRGGWGCVMRLIGGYWRTFRGLEQPLADLFEARSLDEQRQIYERHLRGRVWTPWFSWLLSRPVCHALLGIPARQRQFILNYPGGLFRWGQALLDDLVANIPFATNYFMRANVLGAYAPDCCPEYLTPDGFSRLKSGLLERLTIDTASVTEYLRQTRPGISKFALLDHLDWLEPQPLADEWEAIVAKANPGATVIFRSALAHVDYLDGLGVRIDGRQAALGSLLVYDRQQAAALHASDRVHLYGSFSVARLPQ
ncbi:MAG TPA: BtaA family protein [Pirellulaceae bacterium]|nr:BtaA family protein [Pirellulaceae bacterium]